MGAKETLGYGRETESNPYTAVYNDCLALWEIRKAFQRTTDPQQAERSDFESYPIRRTGKDDPAREMLEGLITPLSQNYSTPEDRELELNKTIYVSMRSLSSIHDEDPRIFVSIPASDLYMILAPERATVVHQGTRSAESSDIAKLQIFIDAAKSLPEELLQEYTRVSEWSVNQSVEDLRDESIIRDCV